MSCGRFYKQTSIRSIDGLIGRFRPLDCWSLTLLVHLIVQPTLFFQSAVNLVIYFPLFCCFRANIGWLFFAFIKNCLGSFLLAVASLPILVQSFYEWPLLGSFLTFLLLPILNGSCYRF